MNDELLNLFNKQINREFYTSYLYYAMSAYFNKILMQSFSLYMKHLASIELAVAQKMHEYLILRNEKLLFFTIDEPVSDWRDVSEIFNHILQQENFLINEIKKLSNFAKNCDDSGIEEFLGEILNQKTNSINKWKNIINEAKKSKVLIGAI